MANTTSGSYVFDKNLSIDEIIEDAYERIGIQGTSGYQLKTARRSLNILFSEWGPIQKIKYLTIFVLFLIDSQKYLEYRYVRMHPL